jgi:hypothetical protein
VHWKFGDRRATNFPCVKLSFAECRPHENADFGMGCGIEPLRA